MKPSDVQPLLYPVNDACRVLGISRSVLYQLLGSGQLEARKLGKLTMIPASCLAAFADQLPPATVTTLPPKKRAQADA